MATIDNRIQVATDYPNAHKDLRVAIEAHDVGLMRSLKVCFPACVKSYDRESHTAEVMPLVKSGHYNGKEWKYTNRPSYRVSVRSVQCGGFTIDVPLYVGDTGWVIASDRDTTHLKEEGALTAAVLSGDRPEALLESSYQQKPEQPVIHDFVRGFFIPDNWGKWEYGRFKDGRNLNIAEALYIGSSIPTEDSEQKKEDYEKNDSSSIVIERAGNIHLLASTAKENGRSSHVVLSPLHIKEEITDDKADAIWHSSISVKDGFIKKFDSQDSHFRIEAKEGAAAVQSISNDSNIVSIHMCEGELTIQATGDIAIEADENIQIVSESEVEISAKAISIETTQNTNILSDGTVNIKSGGEVNVAGGGDLFMQAHSIDFASAENITLKSGNNIEIKGSAGVAYNIHGEGDLRISTSHPISMKAGYLWWEDDKSKCISMGGGAIELNSPVKTIDKKGNYIYGDTKISGSSMRASAKRINLIGHTGSSISGYSEGKIKDAMDRPEYVIVP